jgi:hypothetical protein
MFIKKKNMNNFKVFKIYPNAYKIDDLLKTHLHEKK